MMTILRIQENHFPCKKKKLSEEEIRVCHDIKKGKKIIFIQSVIQSTNILRGYYIRHSTGI